MKEFIDIKNTKYVCNNCEQTIDCIGDIDKNYLYICANLECPNYGILQLAEENIKTIKKEKKK